jgi:hypothetical protein
LVAHCFPICVNCSLQQTYRQGISLN